MRRILFYLPTDLRAIGGAERYTMHLATAVAQRGHAVTMLAQACSVASPLHFAMPPPDRVGTLPELSLRWVTVSPLCVRVLAQAGDGYRWRIARPAVGMLYQACVRPALRRVVAACQPEFICTTISGIVYAAEAMLAVARQVDIPSGLIPLIHTANAGYAGRRFCRLYRSAERVFTLTRYEADWLLTLGVRPEQVAVIGASATRQPEPLAEPGLHARVGLPAGAPVVLFVGRKVRSKGYRALLGAMPRVWQSIPTACVLFIGPAGPDWAADSRPYQDDARMIDLGEADEALVQRALADCSLLCVPSMEESFGMVYAEAWQYGKPVIAADIPVTRELIAGCEGGLLVVSEAEQVAAAIVYLLTNPEQARAMGQRGRQQSARVHTWEQVATRFEQAL